MASSSLVIVLTKLWKAMGSGGVVKVAMLWIMEGVSCGSGGVVPAIGAAHPQPSPCTLACLEYNSSMIFYDARYFCECYFTSCVAQLDDREEGM